MATDLSSAPEHRRPVLRRSAGGKRIVVASLEHRVQLPPPDAHVAAIEDRQRECVLEQTTEWSLMIIAVDADHAHEIGDHAYRGLGAENLRLDCKLLSGRRLTVKRTAGAPAE